MTHEVVRTDCGPLAILDLATGQVMHPIVGPLEEARDLYVEQSNLCARLAVGTDPLVLLDVGLGAGTNAALAWHASEARHSGRRLEIVSFDNTTAALELALQHAADFALDGAIDAAARALLSRGYHETEKTRWRLVLGDLPDTFAGEPAGRAEIIFWDVFGLKANPTLWTVAAFSALYRTCAPNALLCTYSSATSVRTALLLAGFFVGEGRISGGGRKTTTASLSKEALASPLDQRFLDRLTRSSLPFPTDAPPDAALKIRHRPQFNLPGAMTE